jgi:hypothetical protein
MQPVPAFERSVTDAATAQRLYRALVTLPVASPGRWCPYGIGTGFRLTFTDTTRVLLAANVESDGCRDAVLAGLDRRATSESFWDTFATALGFDSGNKHTLFPQPLVPRLAAGSPAPALRDRFRPRRP